MWESTVISRIIEGHAHTANCSAHIFQSLWLYVYLQFIYRFTIRFSGGKKLFRIPICVFSIQCALMLQITSEMEFTYLFLVISNWFLLSFISFIPHIKWTKKKSKNALPLSASNYLIYHFPTDRFSRLLFIALWIVYGHVGR